MGQYGYSLRNWLHVYEGDRKVKNEKKYGLALVIFAFTFFLTGCLHPRIGPQSVPRDRVDYSSSLSDSWKQETLLNIVKVRYLDPPVFVDVGSVVASYSLAQTVSAGVNVLPGGGSNGNLNGSVGLSSSPTITYTPLTGNDYFKGLITPLSPEVLFGAMQNGLPADSVLFTSFVSINGLRNQRAGLAGITPSDPGFDRVTQLMRQIQVSGAVRLYVKRVVKKNNDKAKDDEDQDDKKGKNDEDQDDKKDKDDEDKDESAQETRIITLRTKDISPEIVADINELRQLLHLNPTATDFELTNAPLPSSDTEIAVQTRSIIELIKTMAVEVEVPPEDVSQHRAAAGFATGHPVPGVIPIIRIGSSKQKPDDAFVAVHYRNLWFRIDDNDLPSKAVFAQLMELFTMIDTSNKQNVPVVTIPAR